jgi:hypothetical protein
MSFAHARPAALALAGVLALGAAGRALPAQPPDSVVAFRLKDQFGAETDAATFRGRAFYIVAAGRGGRAPATAWGGLLPRALAAAGAPGDAAAPVVLVADLHSVPRLLRGLVRGRFPGARRDAVLLDWGGTVAGRLGLDGERCTVLAVSPAGRPALRAVTTTADSAEVAAFVRRAAAALAADARPATAAR